MLRIDIIVASALLYSALALSYIPYSVEWAQSPIGMRVDYALFYVRTFQFHAGLFMLLLAVAAMLFRWWKLAAAAVPFLLFTLLPATASYLPRSDAGTADGLKLVSCNLLYVNPNIDELAGKIAALRPDIVCVQELTSKLDSVLRSALGEEFRHVATIPQLDAFGIGVYSRLPFAAAPGEAIPDRDMVPQQRIVFNARGTTVTLYNIHLYPPGTLLDYRDMSWQVDQLVRAIRREKGPLILVGDFNFPNRTRQARFIESTGLRDAYVMRGHGRGSTWPAIYPLKIFPGLGLDHLYLSHGLACNSIEVLGAPGSDHRMLVAHVQLP